MRGVLWQEVLAGLGVGGLAVALAAQSTLQNFISGITLYFDQPSDWGLLQIWQQRWHSRVRQDAVN
ncbi:mechanosensitive ion channel domain-containing protein [Orrella marina]|uniref:mechanosensitive ion channel domain-containing protein n=1 Tax=Orrella marina TaxID=2163011 RepID=UPI001882DE55|nr:mechanosensitive ion channel domain-containing protein [Orrella marina]